MSSPSSSQPTVPQPAVPPPVVPPPVPSAIDLDDARLLALVGGRRVAVVGASDDPVRPSNAVVRALLDAGYEVVPVNPTVSEVHGRQAHPSLEAVPGRVDVVDVVRAPEHLPAVARAAVARGDVGVVWNQLGLVSAEARALVRDAGLGYVEDACMQAEVAATGRRAPTGPRLDHEVVLLDLDDTLLDHDACERAAVAATLAAFDLPGDGQVVDTYVRHNAELWERYRDGAIAPEVLRTERWDRTLRAIERSGDVPAISAHYLEQFAATGALLPGAAEALWWLARRARVAICTNGFRSVQQQRLAATGLDVLVHAFVSSEEAGVAKPDPTSLHLALERLGSSGADPARVVVVGDQLATDVAAGHALGAHTVWIAPDDAVVPAGLREPHLRVAALAAVA